MNDLTPPAVDAAGVAGVRSPFANALILPFELGADWLACGQSIARKAPFFLLAATLITLLARWQLDLVGTGELIVLSFFTDAVVFTWVYMGVAARLVFAAPPLRSGYRALAGRWQVVATCGLWGMPAAAVSYAMFAYAPELVTALVLLVGSNLAGLAALLVVLLFAAYVTFLLSLLPVLSAIQCALDPHANFKVAGLWALRALRAGHRPLAVVFVTFITACVLAGAGLTYLFGHMPVQWLQDHAQIRAVLDYWYAWPGLFVALFVFLSMLHPMAFDLLAAADQDLSDEVIGHAHKALHGERHIGWVLQQFGFGLRVLAAFSFLLAVMYAAIGAADSMPSGLALAPVMYGMGKWLSSLGKAKSTATEP